MSDLLVRLIADGTDPALVAEVAMLLAEKKLASDALEARKAKDRERQSRRRSRDVTDCHVTTRDPSLSPSPLSSPHTPQQTPRPHTHPDKTPTRVRGPAKPEGVKDQTWADFLDLRKRKRAPLTETALDGIIREAGKAGWTLEAALAETVTRGWQSFKADFVAEKAQPASAPPANDYLAHLTTRRERQAQANAP
jgi:hypothetical protein